MRLTQLLPYVPEWPAFRAQRLEEAYITDGRGEIVFDLRGQNVVVYRLTSRVDQREFVLMLPVPGDLPDPLANSLVMAAIADAFRALP
jgi:hypothetical protein